MPLKESKLENSYLDFSSAGKFLNNNLLVFLFYWLAAFILYLPAAKAGMVGDMPYMFQDFHTKSLWGFLNPGNGIAMYQVAGLNFYIILKLFGNHIWLWHLLYVTIHAANGILLFIFFGRLLKDSRVDNGLGISFIAVCLFIVCPHASEVVVWKASNHHATATALIFVILLLVQQFMRTQKAWYAFLAAVVFLYSSFSHEFFYLTPWFVLALICYYYFSALIDMAAFRKAFVFFFVPLLLLFAFHLVLLRVVRHTFISHFGSLDYMPAFYYLEKPLKYFFNVVFLGRFYPVQLRNRIYAICAFKPVILAFYALFICFWGYVLLKLKQVNNKLKVLALVSIFLMITYLFLSPVYFAESQLVCYDRYVYPSVGFAALFVVLLFNLIPFRALGFVFTGAYILLNIWFTARVNIYWKQSAYVIKRLLDDMPDPGSKTALLLNLPDNFNGIPMISAQEDGRFKIMRNNLTSHPLHSTIYDVESFNMATIEDGAHVMVINDSVLHVTLNQWGTCWLYSGMGSGSYENKDYKVNMIDEGHWYELTLRHPASDYMLLFESGTEWKVVDWNKKNIDQN